MNKYSSRRLLSVGYASVATITSINHPPKLLEPFHFKIYHKRRSNLPEPPQTSTPSLATQLQAHANALHAHSQGLPKNFPESQIPVPPAVKYKNIKVKKYRSLPSSLHLALIRIRPRKRTKHIARTNTPSPLVKELWISEQWEDKLRPSSPRHITDIKSIQTTKGKDYPRNIYIVKEEVSGLLSPLKGCVLQDLEPIKQGSPIATLAHGLERVLFNPGVHWIQDPRSRVYNYPPWLQTLPKVNEFAFERLTGFVKSSRDKDLRSLAKRQNRSFAGSTSSLSGILTQCYLLISESKEVDTSILSHHFRHEPKTITFGQRMPVTVMLNHADGVYAIDKVNNDDLADKTVLTWLGTALEKFLTTTPEEFKTYMRSTPSITTIDVKPEAYRYSQSKEFVMRSQLDCYDERLPGSGVFDIKTRACVPIRMDILNYEEHSGYLIKTQYGLLESFEREYYDLIRSAFLKYGFQARIGNMDGVIVAYHNADQMFGFQYIPLTEMDERLFGSEEGVGDRVFNKCVSLMEQVMKEIARCFPHQSVEATFETSDIDGGMNVWVEPCEWIGPDSQKPIEQLRVEVTNYVNDEPSRGCHAVSSSQDVAWTIHYKIQRLDVACDVIRQSLQVAKVKQLRAYKKPSFVDGESFEEYLGNLNYGGAPSEITGGFQSALFGRPSKSIIELREISRAGKKELERSAASTKDLPTIVLPHVMTSSQPVFPTTVSELTFAPEQNSGIHQQHKLGTMLEKRTPSPATGTNEELRPTDLQGYSETNSSDADLEDTTSNPCTNAGIEARS